MPLAEAGDAGVLARIVLPGCDPQSAGPFVSIHSNPPVKTKAHPAFVRRAFGKGWFVWNAAALEAAEKPPHRQAFKRIIQTLLTRPVAFKATAHPLVELVLFDQSERSRK